ncbi:acyl-CoA dehydrogenase family protein [Streptomyces sp. H27-D2]|uniref:acyl-CoA dehydrogenase family protein n=1 Tax=Streptomyces sp. H27-D2 TaxID=3046304 RepID=UPI002DBD5A87|nr:acyl-CoA dehydrogenase family protein [Streptomyces sp. H27-D2]MEC4016798.1 acyl-CoA dehydrogenase family protein [Streptomyces sp. H27-D2]
MDFQLTDDQVALRDGVRRLLAGKFGREGLRAAADAGYGSDGEGGIGGEKETGGGSFGAAPVLDRALWAELGAAGFFGLRLPEADGGVGLGLPEAVLIFEEAGRVLLPGPLVATHLAAGFIEGAADGRTVVTMIDGGGRSSGEGLVEYLRAADVVLSLGGEPGGECDAEGEGEGVRVVPPAWISGMRGSPAGLSGPSELWGLTGQSAPTERGASSRFVVELIRSVDPVTPLHRVLHEGFGAPGLTGAPAGAPVAAVLRREAALLTAAQQLGSAARTVEMAVRYARERSQFGQPIGAFQAVKHMCAQMLVRAEIARSGVYAAAAIGGALDIAAAKLLADEAAVRNARDCLQVYGGMGFTWEAEVHLHLKRAWLRAEQWQPAAAGEEALAAGLLRGANVDS